MWYTIAQNYKYVIICDCVIISGWIGFLVIGWHVMLS